MVYTVRMQGNTPSATRSPTMTTTAAEARTHILALVSMESINDFSTADLIREIRNCREVTIHDDGDVSIADPQDRHVLSDDALVDLANRLPA